MSKHFRFLLCSVFLFIAGFVVGRQNYLVLTDYFSKGIFLLIGLKVLSRVDWLFLRLPLILLVSSLMGVFLGVIAFSPVYPYLHFAFYLLGTAPCFFLAALVINEFKEFWNLAIPWRAFLSMLVGFGLYTVCSAFMLLKTPRFSALQFLICLACGYVVSYGTIYLYRRDAEKLNANLALSCFFGVPVLRAIEALKEIRFKNYLLIAYEAAYIPVFTAMVIVAKFEQVNCRLYQKIGWGSTPVPEEIGRCLLETDKVGTSEVLFTYAILVALSFCILAFLKERKRNSWPRRYGKIVFLLILSSVSLTCFRDNMNLTLIAFLCPISALFIKEGTTR